MKISVLLFLLIFLNTSVLIAKPIASLLAGVNIWTFIAIEILLLLAFYAYKTIKDLRKSTALDLNNIKLFIIK